MKTIYIVRHGESEGNAGPYHGTFDVPLTEKGIAQAKLVAKRARSLGAEVLVSSTMTRAKQTTDHILDEVPLPVEYSDLLIERRRPSEILGKLKEDPKNIAIIQAVIDNYCVPGWKYSDEENFEDLKIRAKQAVDLLDARSENTILVVSHGLFTRMIVGHILFGEQFSAEEGNALIYNMATTNTGITTLGKQEGGSWRLLTWNDQAHLGDI